MTARRCVRRTAFAALVAGAVLPSVQPMKAESGCMPEGTEDASLPASVTLQVVLKNARGESLLDARGPITADNVARFAVEPERAERAAHRLRKLGFAVAGEGPVLSVTGDRALVERVFATRIGIGPSGQPELLGPARLPTELEDLVAGVILPQGPELFP